MEKGINDRETVALVFGWDPPCSPSKPLLESSTGTLLFPILRLVGTFSTLRSLTLLGEELLGGPSAQRL